MAGRALLGSLKNGLVSPIQKQPLTLEKADYAKAQRCSRLFGRISATLTSRPAVKGGNRPSNTAVNSAAKADLYVPQFLDVEPEYYEVPVHTVKIHDPYKNKYYEFEVPEDQYILHTGEELGHELPFACRHGCCTACAVKVKSGELLQPLALGISQELKEKGYALMCVGIPRSDLEVEVQDEDEVYWLQFGRYFAKGPVERDDYALELAVADE